MSDQQSGEQAATETETTKTVETEKKETIEQQEKQAPAPDRRETKG